MPPLSRGLFAIAGAAAAGGAAALLLAPRFDPPPARTGLSARVELAFPGLSFRRPLFLTHAGDGTDRVFVLEQHGVVHVFPNDPNARGTRVYLDISRTTSRAHDEEGLLGIAFDPGYRENGLFYVHYSAADPRRSVFSRFRRSADDPDRADPASESVLLEVPDRWGNHNGGMLAFGPDGMLYFSLGDEGAAGDPDNQSQRLDNLFGKIHRVDVRGATTERPYRIPPDNPFAGRPGARPEIWAYGLRNAWRFSFDRETGDLWAGDVGQDREEEVDIVTRGGNYGWRAFEGSLVFDRRLADALRPGEAIPPVATYPRREGISITGGTVYRGRAQPLLRGRYLYGDYVSGFLWALEYDRAARRVARSDFLGDTDLSISSFGEDQAGEVLICSFDGKIRKILAEDRAAPDPPRSR
ncbi:MAG: PQQ-dependent sugar dehydrogenase [Planctomycetales bacterium]|nr:PQQ-dependent sugar dehydrogenase [Planctomycetales bacterium]